MKAARTFVVEIKRNGRRHVAREQEPLWDPKQLKSAINAVEESQRAAEIDPNPTQVSSVGRSKPPHCVPKSTA